MSKVLVDREVLGRAVYAFTSLEKQLPGLRDKGIRWLRDELVATVQEMQEALEQPWAEPVAVWKLVPVEPTAVMVDAGTDGGDAWINENRVRAVYKAMLEAAPQPTQPGGDAA